MAACSSRVGVHGFTPSPIVCLGVGVLETHPVPPQLLLEDVVATAAASSSSPSTTSTDRRHEGTGGITVYKIGPSGELQARRLAITSDRRNLVLSKVTEDDNNKSNSNRGSDAFGGGLVGASIITNALEDLSLFGASVRDAADPPTAYIPLLAVDRIEHGALSHRHLLAAQQHMTTHNKSRSPVVVDRSTLLHRNLRLSVVYKNGPKAGHYYNNYETLDMIVPNEHQCATLYRAVRELLTLHQQERAGLSARIRTLDDAWIELQRFQRWRAPLREQDFVRLCDRLQVPFARGQVSEMFRAECQRCPRGAASSDGRLSFEEVTSLLATAILPLRNKNSSSVVLEKLWHELVESDPIPAVMGPFRLTPGTNASDEADETSISAAAFQEFLQSQGETVSLQSAIDLVQAWNNRQQMGSSCRYNDSDLFPFHQDRLSKSMFFAYLMSDSNDIMDPERSKVGSDDMDKPLHHYYISTSHDTYLKKLPSSFRKLAYPNNPSTYYDAVDEQAYAAALLRGVRCLELTVWNGLDGANPVVARRKPTKAKHPRLAFEVVVRVVRRFLEGHPESFPVLLKIENHATTAVQERMALVLHKQLERPGLLAKPPAARSMEDKSYVLPSPSALRGKVVILGKRTKLCKNLVWNNDFDDEIARFDSIVPLRESSPSDQDEDAFEDDTHVVVGFNANGPIRQKRRDDETNSTPEAPRAFRTVDELVQVAQYEADASKADVERGEARLRELTARANDLEAKAARCTAESGWTVDEVKSWARDLQTAESFQSVADFRDPNPVKGKPDDPSGKARQWSPHRGLYCHQEVDEEDADTSNGTIKSSTEEALLGGPSPDGRVRVERTEQAKMCARKVETWLSTLKEGTAPAALAANASSPSAVVGAFPASDEAFEASPQSARNFDDAFLDSTSRQRDASPINHSFTSFVEERVLAQDLEALFEKERSDSNYENHHGFTASSDRIEEFFTDDKSFDTIPFSPVAEKAYTTGTVSTDLAGKEAAHTYLEAIRARQEATSASETLVVLTRKAKVMEKALAHAFVYKETMNKLVKVPMEMSRLTFFHSTRHAHWSKSVRLSSFQFHSFTHGILLSLLRKCPIEERRSVVAFSKGHLCRVFLPWETVGTSKRANADPVLAWSLGCQLVSCNYHSADESLLVADGLFRQNGNCGYVLKPAHLREHISQPPRPQKWSFRILSGHYLTPPKDAKAAGISSPLVKISVYSGSVNETCVSVRTRPVRHGGLDQVVWNAPSQAVDLVSGSLVSFSVWHRNENGTELFMGASVLPSSCLREGYRSVALLDEDDVRAGASCLLIHAERVR